jgi:hypothetical protein
VAPDHQPAVVPTSKALAQPNGVVGVGPGNDARPTRALAPSPEEIAESADKLDSRFQAIFGANEDRPGLLGDRLLVDFRLQLGQGDMRGFFKEVEADLAGQEAEARATLERAGATAADRDAARQRLEALGQAKSALPGLKAESLRVDAALAANGPARDRWMRAASPHLTREGKDFFRYLEGRGVRVPAGQRDLVFNALRLGPKRVKDRAELDALVQRAQSGDGSMAVRLLGEAGYQSSERIEEVHRRTGVSFLGYDENQLRRFESMWTSGRYSGVLNNAGKPRGERLHDVRLVQAPTVRPGEPPRYKYSPVTKAVTMPSLRGPDDERVFLHEVGHGVEATRLFDSNGGATRVGEQWLRASWRNNGETPVGKRFVDSNGDGLVTTRDPERPGDPERDYSTVNVSEDFAEAFSFYLTADRAGRRRLRLQLGPAKAAILERLIGR